ncbi:uncharacterized protein NEPG_01404 [Nematocida parisii ERTm1]|nr:uncharacterized protein NEPG_01404 [Nematocida parisii ERTm1]EIJ93832.1 hypothetical protein NEPG_01404 [Nematocida parisii ERTm1]KAI5146276.1 hypothetical protein NEPAR07_2246 [Nematocida parisii]KAI5159008.1 hypothetical protein NEPAR05_2351 [Nematocida parisii]|eukprot:XP_013059232.1 hypothetical protein NEPG_01404 [Nematocida parisii ERTm1]
MRDQKYKQDILQWMACGATVSAVLYGVYKYITQDRSTPEGLKDEGNKYFLLKDYSNALLKYLTALELFNKWVEQGVSINTGIQVKILNNISQTYFITKEYKKSIEYIENTLKIKSIHYNSFKRLAQLEEIDQGYGDVKGLAVITAYLILHKSYNEKASKNQNIKKNDENFDNENFKWNEILSKKIEKLSIKKSKEITVIKNFSVSFVKLEEILTIFNDPLQNNSVFGEKTQEDIKILNFIKNKNFDDIINYLNKTEKNQFSKRVSFIAGNIKYIRNENNEAISLFNMSDTIYGDVLTLYIKKLENSKSKFDENKILKIMNTTDPIVRMYVIQLHLISDNIGHYLAKLIELQSEELISLPYIANIKSQYSLYEYKESISTLQKAVKIFPNDLNLLCAGVEILSQEFLKLKISEKITDIFIKKNQNLKSKYDLLKNILSKLSEFKNSPRAVFFMYIGYNSLNNTKYIDLLMKSVDLDKYNSTLLVQLGQYKISTGDLTGFNDLERACRISVDGSESIYKLLYTYRSIYSVQEYYPDISNIVIDNLST